MTFWTLSSYWKILSNSQFFSLKYRQRLSVECKKIININIKFSRVISHIQLIQGIWHVDMWHHSKIWCWYLWFKPLTAQNWPKWKWPFVNARLAFRFCCPLILFSLKHLWFRFQTVHRCVFMCKILHMWHLRSQLSIMFMFYW